MELKNQEAQEVLQALPDGVAMVDHALNLLFANQKAKKLLSLPKNLKEHPEQAFRTFINKKKKGMLTLTLHEPAPCDLEIEMLPMSLGFLLVIQDVTAMKQLELLVRRSNRMMELGELAAMVAHDIRNPLGGIKGFAALLERDLEKQPDLQKMAHSIIAGTDKLNRLVTQILDYSRPLNPKFTTHSLTKLLRELEISIREDQHASSLYDLQIYLPDTPCRTIVDPDLFSSALYNLVLNGFQAMQAGGLVKIHLKEMGETWEINVRDDGEGIPTQNLDKIFSPIFTTKPQGNGFGLAEVHKVITAHHGTVTVQSSIGCGSTFIINIPKQVSHAH